MRARSEKFGVSGEVQSMYIRDDHGQDIEVNTLEEADWLYLKKDSDGTVVYLRKDRDEVRVTS